MPLRFASPTVQIRCGVTPLADADVTEAGPVNFGVGVTWTCRAGFDNEQGVHQGQYQSATCGAAGTALGPPGSCTQVRLPQCRVCCRAVRSEDIVRNPLMLFVHPTLQIDCHVVTLANADRAANTVLYGITAGWTCRDGFANSDGRNQGEYTSESCGAGGLALSASGGCTQVRLGSLSCP